MAQVAPTPRDVLWRDGSACALPLPPARQRESRRRRCPCWSCPSMINRWYVVDLRAGASLVEALVAGGLDVYCLDWGTAPDEDRYLTWDDVLARLGRAVRFVERACGRAAASGCSATAWARRSRASTRPSSRSTSRRCINLAGPFDFAHGGLLRTMVDPKWFDASRRRRGGQRLADADAERLRRPAAQRRSSPSGWASSTACTSRRRATSFDALEAWAGDNIPFPGSAYATYIEDLYQKNALVQGEHHVRGQARRPRRASAARCSPSRPSATPSARCPRRGRSTRRAAAPTRSSSSCPGGHVGAVVGSRAPEGPLPGDARLAASEARDHANGRGKRGRSCN